MTQGNANEFCPRDSSKTKHWQKWSFNFISGSYSYFDAKEECATNHGGDLLTLNEPGAVAAFESYAASVSLTGGDYWTTLRDYDKEKSQTCNDASCDNVLQWGDGTAFSYDVGEYPSGVNYALTASTRSQCGVLTVSSFSITTIKDEYCLSGRSLICQVNCHEGMCPADKPFPMNDGADCCESFKRTTTGGVCDGGDLLITDPVECCAGQSASCSTTAYPCTKHPNADRFCPANPSLTRVGGDTGYYFKKADLAKRYLDSAMFCNSKEAGHINVPTVVEGKEGSAIIRDEQLPSTSYSFWSGLTHPNQLPKSPCFDAGCNTHEWTWSDGTKFTYDATVSSQVAMSSVIHIGCASYGSPLDLKNQDTLHNGANCLTGIRRTICQGSCALSDPDRCPASHPYPIDNGAHCCRTFQVTT